MNCPYCAASLPDGSRLCQYCGRLLAPTAPTRPQAPPGQPGPSYGQPMAPGQFGRVGGAAGPRPYYGHDLYSPLFDLNQLPPEQTDVYRRHRFHATSSVLVAIILHFVTFGTLSWFFIARKHAFLPRIKPDDFSAARAAGFLFIPFFSLYWFFVLLRRTSERLVLQTKLWGVGQAPSRGFATALAVLTVLDAIPYLGLLVFLIAYVFVWPLYLGRVQATCNALALAAAPDFARPAMLQLERWARLRWLGWMALAPSIVVMGSAVGVIFGSAQVDQSESVIGMMMFAAVAAGGGAMLYAGSHQTRSAYHALSESTPHIVAGYLRIDKNAAWASFWVCVVVGLISLVSGLGSLNSVGVPSVADDAWSALGQFAGCGLLAAYAFSKALQLRGQIHWLEWVASTQ